MADENAERIREIDELRDKFAKEKSEMREKLESEKSNIINRLQKENDDLRSQLDSAKVKINFQPDIYIKKLEKIISEWFKDRNG